MDNDASSVNRNKDDKSKQSEDKKIKDGVDADKSLIEVTPEIPVVDEKTMVDTTDPARLKKCEEDTAKGDAENKLAKKESSEEDKSNKTAGESKIGELKSEADTLILEIDNTDNLDVYLEKTKNRANAEKKKLARESIEEAENNKAAECTPAKANEAEENAPIPEKIGDSVSTNASECKKKAVKKRPLVKAKSLSDEAEKAALQQKSDTKEVARKQIQCKTEPVNGDDHKDKVKAEVKPNVEDKPAAKTLNEPAVKSEDKKFVIKSEDKKLESPRFVWISNISKNTKATDLKLHLSSYSHGKVMTAKIVTDGKLYFGHVVMEKREDVDNCIKNLDETVFEGRKIRLSDRVPERKTNKSQNVEQTQVKSEPVSPDQTKIKNSPEVKPEKETPVGTPAERKRKRSRSFDPLTLRVASSSKRFDRSSERRKRKHEEMQRRKRDEEERRRREFEREREERRKQKIKEEERRQAELKLERERKKLEREREIIEREKFDLLRLQKKLADTERYVLNRQKDEIERNIRSISEDYKKRKSPGDFGGVAKHKFGRVEMEEPRRPPENKEYWKTQERRSSPVKAKKECFGIESYPTKKSSREDNVVVAPPPPRILGDNFDLSDRRRKEKERIWESRGYEKKEFSERPVFKERKPVDEYSFGDRRESVQEKSCNSREHYKPKYEKAPTGNWEKCSSAPYKSGPSSASWRSDVVRVVHRHPPSSFPAPPQYGSTSGMTHYYPQPDQYPRQNEFYGRPPERKY